MIILVAPKRPGWKRLFGCRNSRMVGRVWLESMADGVRLFEYTGGTNSDVSGRSADVDGVDSDVSGRSADVDGVDSDVSGRSAGATGFADTLRLVGATGPIDSRQPAGTTGQADTAAVESGPEEMDAQRMEPGPGEMDAGFLAGLLSERMGGFRNKGVDSVIAILSEASPDEELIGTPLISIDEVSGIGDRNLYPDIVLGHDFSTDRGLYSPDSFSGRMLTALHPYTQTHQLLHFRLAGFDYPGGPAYRRSNALMAFLRDTALLHPAANTVSISNPGDSPI